MSRNLLARAASLLTFLASTLLVGSAAGPAWARPAESPFDTLLAVRPGTRLQLSNFRGDISVGTWNRNAVRIEAEPEPGATVRIASANGVLQVTARPRHFPATVDYQIRVPLWMGLELEAVESDISVDGVNGRLDIETVKGDIHVRQAGGGLRAQSVEGDVILERVRGTIEAASVNQDVQVQNAEGRLTAESVNGDIGLSDVSSEAVDATTLNGTIVYDGSLGRGGRYRFGTHNGNISVAIPQRAGATISVNSFSGGFDATFPVSLTSTKKGKSFDFVLGDGGAQLELESFQGTIQLRRPGEAPEFEEDERPRHRHLRVPRPPKPPKVPKVQKHQVIPEDEVEPPDDEE